MNFRRNLCVLFLMLVIVLTGDMAISAPRGAPISVDSRIKTFVYSQNEIFPVVFNYRYQSYIEFSKGETIKVIAMGDKVNWKVLPVENKLFIMPLEREGQTNMLIETSKGRSYAFDLISKSVAPGEESSGFYGLGKSDSPLADLAYVVRFYYPQDSNEFELRRVNINDISAPSLAHAHQGKEIVIAPNNTTKHYVHFTKSTEKGLIPVHTFDDGSLTYFKFYDNNRPVPRILAVQGKRVTPCRMLLLKGYVIIEGVHKQLYLDYGNNSIVKVTNQALS